MSLCGAYLMALGVNTLRIVLSMALYQADIYSAWLTPAALHRLAGVWLYLGALGLFFKGLQPIIIYFVRDRFRSGTCRSYRRVVWPAWLPLGWYITGAVGVPLANLVFRHPLPAFGEHCLTVVVSAVVLWAGSRFIKVLLNGLKMRLPGDNRSIQNRTGPESKQGKAQ